MQKLLKERSKGKRKSLLQSQKKRRVGTNFFLNLLVVVEEDPIKKLTPEELVQTGVEEIPFTDFLSEGFFQQMGEISDVQISQD